MQRFVFTKAMHVKLVHKDSKQMIFVLFIYATNLPTDRRTLWSDLGAHKQVVRNLPWFIDAFQGAYGVFQPYRISDHSPTVLKIPGLTVNKRKLFKFFNFITYKNQFLDVVANSWNDNVHGHNMFKVVSNLKTLKKPLRKLIYDKGEEAVYLHAFNEAKLDEERLLQQKAKIDWLDAFVSHYEKFLGCSMDCDNINSNEIFLKKVSNVANLNMVHPISERKFKEGRCLHRQCKASRPDRKRISHKRTKNKAKNDKTLSTEWKGVKRRQAKSKPMSIKPKSQT
ncbi:hypothetical protein Tco_1031496 [Tanacetum coccineum]|uniref:Uncharacterized protein n=1 Tax=Tanacetum coccineum TaxID=301880 RepID=A0ABQ5GAN8_9ASTR